MIFGPWGPKILRILGPPGPKGPFGEAKGLSQTEWIEGPEVSGSKNGWEIEDLIHFWIL